jgi:hypothetical protein
MDSQPIEIVTVESLSGFPEGTIDKNGETIVADLDDKGNVIGWHKEPAEGVK